MTRSAYFTRCSNWIPALFFLAVLYPAASQAQQKITDYVLFAGKDKCAGCAVQIGSASTIKGGAIGSYTLVKSTGSATLNANIHSGGTVQLANSNIVTGKISAANSASQSGTILSVGSAAKQLSTGAGRLKKV